MEPPLTIAATTKPAPPLDTKSDYMDSTPMTAAGHMHPLHRSHLPSPAGTHSGYDFLKTSKGVRDVNRLGWLYVRV